MIQPVRITLSRAAGFRLQAHSYALNGLPCVKVDRTTRWGNPFTLEEAQEHQRYTGEKGDPATWSVEWFRMWITFQISGGRHMPPTLSHVRDMLRGKNLACWCKLHINGEYSPCHADVLLSLANDIPIEEVIRENLRRATGEAVR